jgi:hypothetical protein
MTTAMTTRAPAASADPALTTWAIRINDALSRTVAGIFETGRQLEAAHAALDHGQWIKLFADQHVPIGVRTAQRLIEIYERRDALTANATHASHLPPSWMTLYELAQLPDDTLAWAHAHGKITAALERKNVAQLKAEFVGAAPAPEARVEFVADMTTPGSRLLDRIERQLLREFYPLDEDDRGFVVSMLRQFVERLAKEIHS